MTEQKSEYDISKEHLAFREPIPEGVISDDLQQA